MHIKEETLLYNGKYKIKKVLGQGGFGITYLAEQVALHRKVAIKEFFMKEYCNREIDTLQVSVPSVGSKEFVVRFRDKFIKEAQNIACLNHPNIIRIYDVFEENNTAYYVMEYIDNSLSDYLNEKGRLPEHEAIRYIKQIADALAYIHEQKINHLDVKPANILLDNKNNAVLIDFGLSKHYDEDGNQTSTTPIGISHGYAPLEQYKNGGVGIFSPTTDIYSLAATLYKLVTGQTPPDAGDVNEDGLPSFPSDISKSTVNAITQAMQGSRKKRPQSIAEFLEILGDTEPSNSNNSNHSHTSTNEETILDIEEPETPKTPQEPIKHNKPKEQPKKSNNSKTILIAIIAIILGFGGYFVYTNIQEKKAEEARIEAEKRAKEEEEAKHQAEEKKRLEYEKMQGDKSAYIGLISEGDKLLNNRRYSEAISKYEQAKTYEDRYSDTEYTDDFNKGVSQKITLAIKAEQEYKAEQARLEKEQQEREAAAKAEQARLEKERQEKKLLEQYNRTHGSKNGHDWVDLGLSVKWATCNVGSSKAEDYGNYYAWGETSTKAKYAEENSLTYGIIPDKLKSLGYKDEEGNLTPSHDAVRANWGSTWRLPTQAEMEELENKCTWKWTTQNGVNGYKITGPNGNSIFLPAAGNRSGASLYRSGEYGYYWSSTSFEGNINRAHSLYFDNGYQNVSWNLRYSGLSVRPVTE